VIEKASIHLFCLAFKANRLGKINFASRKSTLFSLFTRNRIFQSHRDKILCHIGGKIGILPRRRMHFQFPCYFQRRLRVLCVPGGNFATAFPPLQTHQAGRLLTSSSQIQSARTKKQQRRRRRHFKYKTANSHIQQRQCKMPCVCIFIQIAFAAELKRKEIIREAKYLRSMCVCRKKRPQPS